MVDTNQLRAALEKTGIEPDQAAALAPELARHVATAGAYPCAGDRTGGTRKVHRVKPGSELARLPQLSVKTLATD